MKRYNIYEDGYWSSSNGFDGYWSKFKDSGAIKNRIKYLKLSGFLMILVMRIMNHDLKPKLCVISGDGE